MLNAKTILLVEDNPGDVELTKRALRKSSIESRLDVVEDGAEAIDYLFCRGDFADRNPNTAPSLILLDLNLPKINGLDVLKLIRANTQTRRLPVVILTSSQEDIDLITAYNNGANSYIRKPVDFNEFTQAINQLGLYWLKLNEAPPNG
ncbi:MAG: response regulator [Candidatus Cloacimonas sp.]|jgi:CheY-like chemotaxis protein|nr:response regulator [Candidatus Cloacimonas sp.]